MSKRKITPTQYANVRRIGKTYQASWVDEHGTRLSSTGSRTAAEAHELQEQEATRARKLRLRRQFPSFDPGVLDESLTTLDAFERHLTYMAARTPDRRPTTVERDWNMYSKWISEDFGERAVSTITDDELRSWQARLVQSNSTSYSQRVRRLFSNVMVQARTAGAIHANPFDDQVRVPKIAKSTKARAQTKQKHLSDDQMRRLIEEVARIDNHYRVMMILWANAGLRPAEVFALQERDFSTVAVNGRSYVMMSVRRTLVVSSSRPPELLDTMKTEASRRRIPLPGAIWAEVQAHIERYGVGPGGLLFRSPEGGLINNNNFRKRVLRPAADAAGLHAPGLGSIVGYSMRHAHSNQLQNEGRSIAQVARRLGTSPRMVAQHYSEAIEDGDIDLVREQLLGVDEQSTNIFGGEIVSLDARRRQSLASS